MYDHDRGRRGSLGAGVGSALAAQGGPQDRPMTSHPFPARVMPPPTSPQRHTPHQYPAQHVHTPGYGGTRELPSLSALRTPGSNGMSISSMISSAGSSVYEDPRSTAYRRQGVSPMNPNARPASPPMAQNRTIGFDVDSWRRPGTPERSPINNGHRTDPRPSYTGSADRVFGAHPPGGEYARHPSTSLHRYSTSNAERSQYPAGDFYGDSTWRRADTNLPQRPTSQPAAGLGGHRLPPPPSYPANRHPEPFSMSPINRLQANYSEDQNRLRSLSDPRAHDVGRASTVQPLPITSYNIPPVRHDVSNSHGRITDRYDVSKSSPDARQTSDDPHFDYSKRAAMSSEMSFESPHGREPPTSAYGVQIAPHPHGNASVPPAEQHRNNVGLYQTNPSSRNEHRLDSVAEGSPAEPQARPYPYEPNPARMGEELQQQRSYLNVSPETVRLRSLGRASPLPQAVKGASAEYKGPGGAPGIKNEFGRMFSGLGSGLGGSGNGVTTPSRGSPLPQERIDSNDSRMSGIDSLEMVRSGSRGLKRNKRWKDEDLDGVDRIGTPSGPKRSKMSHTMIHHHHPHMVHHHHHRADDEPNRVATPGLSAPGAGAQPLAAQTYIQSPQIPAHHHHYHYHLPAHNYGHALHPLGRAVKTPTPVTTELQKRHTTVTSLPVLQAVSAKPRRYLGSMLYSVKYDLPARTTATSIYVAPSTMLGTVDKFGYSMIPTPIPNLDPVLSLNGLFAVRVPRFYFANDKLQEITRNRYLWGSQVYTDDSDPIAAAIHSGWFRGAWPDGVEDFLLGPQKLSIEAQKTVLTYPPENGPLSAPGGFDAQITLLILPPLESYASTTSFGIKSRKWGGNHDGLSFMIHKVEWLKDGVYGGSWARDRGMAAKKRSMKEGFSGRVKALAWLEHMEMQ